MLADIPIRNVAPMVFKAIFSLHRPGNVRQCTAIEQAGGRATGGSMMRTYWDVPGRSNRPAAGPRRIPELNVFSQR